MRKNVLLLLIFVLINLFAISCALKKDKSNKIAKSKEIQNTLSYLAENLEQAKYDPIRVGWQFDYGFKDGWLLNKFEYIRSLLTYKDFQAKLKYPIYISGPHTSDNLDLNSKYSFGHYNPKFVAELRKNTMLVLGKKDFITRTKLLLEKYDILEFLKKHKEIYTFIQEYPDEYNRIKSNYIRDIQDETLSENAYRTMLPPLLDDGNYWNWSETSYHFWIRRDIDNTKDIWIGIVDDVLNAYK